MKNKLAFCLITCDVKSMYKFLFPSIKYIKSLSMFSCFNIIFQPPYTLEQINEIVSTIENYGFEVNYKYKKYDNPSDKLIKIRMDCSALSINNFYVNLDDDMEFLEGVDLQYLNLIYQMCINKNIGVAILSNDCGWSRCITYANIITLSYSTKRGVITRRVENSKYNIFPEYFYNFVGSHDDIIKACYQNLIGLSTIELQGGLCNHYENRIIDGSVEYNWDKYNECDNSILNWWKKNCNKFKPTLYNSPVCNFDDEIANDCYKKGVVKILNKNDKNKRKNKIKIIKNKEYLLNAINNSSTNM